MKRGSFLPGMMQHITYTLNWHKKQLFLLHGLCMLSMLSMQHNYVTHSKTGICNMLITVRTGVAAADAQQPSQRVFRRSGDYGSESA